MKYSMILGLIFLVITACHASENLKRNNIIDNASTLTINNPISENEQLQKSLDNQISLLNSNRNNLENSVDIPSGTLIHAKILVGGEFSLRNIKSEPILLEAKFIKLLDENIVLHNCRIIAIPSKEIIQNRLNAETSTISCINKNGLLFESFIHGYLSDTDNMIGIKGSITNLLEGMNSLPKNIQKNIKNMTSKNKISSADDVSKWYLYQMEETLPILTISSGKDVNVITTSAILLRNI